MQNRFIPGIHNYCDRWCERCYFTSRCRIYLPMQDTDTSEMTDSERDAHYKKMWDLFEKKFKELETGLRNKLDEFSPDWEECWEDHDVPEWEPPKTDEVETHSLVKAARNYGMGLVGLLEGEDSFLKQIESELAEQKLLTMAAGQQPKALEQAGNALEVVQFYSLFISAKLHRAVGGKKDEAEEEWADDMPKDSDGSAKIAMIAVNRSIAAWSILHKAYPRFEKQILPFIATLKRILSHTEKLFPEAPNFVRPGFDEPEHLGHLN